MRKLFKKVIDIAKREWFLLIMMAFISLLFIAYELL